MTLELALAGVLLVGLVHSSTESFSVVCTQVLRCVCDFVPLIERVDSIPGAFQKLSFSSSSSCNLYPVSTTELYLKRSELLFAMLVLLCNAK